MSILKDLIFVFTFVMFLYFCISYFRLRLQHRKLIEHFTGTLLHDLKTPTLAQLRGVELLGNNVIGTLNPEQKELVTQIQESCRYTLDMISMILKTYRIENGKKALIKETFCLSELLNECFEEIASKAEEKNLEFVYKSVPNTFIEADRADIKTVISNLLMNAVTHSDKNEKIYVSLDLNSRKLKMEIKNKGAVFSMPQQYSAIGEGIKLILSKKIVHYHHGSIFAVREGSDTNRFTFTLPVRAWKHFNFT